MQNGTSFGERNRSNTRGASMRVFWTVPVRLLLLLSASLVVAHDEGSRMDMGACPVGMDHCVVGGRFAVGWRCVPSRPDTGTGLVDFVVRAQVATPGSTSVTEGPARWLGL